MINDYLGLELTVILLFLLTVIIIIPLLLGVLIAIAFQQTGGNYIWTVISVASLIWIIVYLWWII